jgi:ABC-2 type transport system permease protein
MPTHLIKAYLKVWLKLTVQQFQSQVANSRGAAALFIFGKLFRLASALLLVYVVVGKAKLMAGYSLNEAILLLMLFNLTQTISQLFLRGVYLFRQKVVDGTFDFYLLNPLSELFYSLFSYTDPLDIIVTTPYIFFVGWAWVNAGYLITLPAIFLLLLIVFLSVLMVTAWHIIIIAIGVKYLEVDNTVMLYRDIERMGAFPVAIYGKLGENILTYVFPFALMATIPANLIFGMFNPWYLLIFAALSIIQLKIALIIWRRALLSYSSASS